MHASSYIIPWSSSSWILHNHNFNILYLDLLVVGSFITITSEISPNFEKYSFNPSGVVCQDNPPTNIFLNRNKILKKKLIFLPAFFYCSPCKDIIFLFIETSLIYSFFHSEIKKVNFSWRFRLAQTKKELSLLYIIWVSNPFICPTQYVVDLRYFKLWNLLNKNLSLKYLRTRFKPNMVAKI